ncbi:MAG TPA: GNAT family N-acetyltransferase [Candidatus Binataceae bacterium]|nr:GNAT family N-acetyltransferase [Candidatus Binataceae bacterium]
MARANEISHDGSASEARVVPIGDIKYPAHREADVVLRDGSTIRIRPVRSEDEEALFEFLRGLSENSRAMRFFAVTGDSALAKEARRSADVDYANRYGLVATIGPEQRIVGHALYVADEHESAEVGFTIADDYQGRGLGTVLLGHLAEVATTNGFKVFKAHVRPENRRMVDVFRESGFPTELRAEPGELEIAFPTSLSQEALERFDQRERVGAVNSLLWFFNPRSIAVIGASRRRGTIGGEIFHNLLSYGFAGVVYPVNPNAEVVQAVPAYRSVEEIRGNVDLGIIAVPAEHALDAVQQCARKGVRALIVISSGFAEVGEAGYARQKELVRLCRAAGMRLIGPNCMGLVNTNPKVRLDATFAPQTPPTGRIGFSSQSGALGLAILEYAHALDLGISTFVSIGNKTDISGNDLLTYWESDPDTDVILMYLESFGNPRKFSHIARRIGRVKPIVAVKSGRMPAGARATSSHTGALLAASDITVDALFRQSGVIRTDTLEEMFRVASLLAHQPLPKGRRVGIITNAGGPGILCADTCEAQGLQIPILSAETQAQLQACLPAEATVINPVDMIASASAEHYREVISIVAADPGIDALIVIFIPPLVTRAEDVARAIIDNARQLGKAKPILAVCMTARGIADQLRTADVRVPSFDFPEAAAITLAHVARYAEWRSRPLATPPKLDGIARDEAAAIVAMALRRGEGWLAPSETLSVLTCYGIPFIEQREVKDWESAVLAAEKMGGELALKAVAPGLVHKTEFGAVRLHLKNAEEVRKAAREISERLAPLGYTPTSYLVQRMAPEGVEMLLGVAHDPQFGPVLACGVGGVMVELLRDVSIRLAPLTRQDVTEMIKGLRTYPLLTGFRGGPTCDVTALEDALLRVSMMVDDLPQIAELDLNPTFVHPNGVTVVDARIRVAPSSPPRPLGARG